MDRSRQATKGKEKKLTGLSRPFLAHIPILFYYLGEDHDPPGSYLEFAISPAESNYTPEL